MFWKLCGILILLQIVTYDRLVIVLDKYMNILTCQFFNQERAVVDRVFYRKHLMSYFECFVADVHVEKLWIIDC